MRVSFLDCGPGPGLVPGPGAVVDYNRRRRSKCNELTTGITKRETVVLVGMKWEKEREHRWTTAMKGFGRQLLTMFRLDVAARQL